MTPPRLPHLTLVPAGLRLRRLVLALCTVVSGAALGNATTNYEYDANGNLTKVTDPVGHATVNSYDALNRLIQATDPAGGLVKYTYNGQDRLTQVTDPRNLATTYSVDGLGNLLSQTSPDTGTTLNTYDAAGNLLTKTDAKGQTTSYHYDALNRVTQVTYADGSGVLNTYDAGTNGIGRLTQIQETNAASAVVATLQYTYDPLGRVITETRLINGITYTTAYAYTNGRLTRLIYPSGRQLDYTLDVQGRISQIQLTDKGAVKILASSVQYQPFGGVKSFIDGSGQTYTRSYDLDGRIASYTLGTQTLLVGYDPASRITFQTDAGNAANTVSYAYDTLDRLTSAVLPATNLGYGYDATGNRTSQTLGGTTRSYSTSPSSNRLLGIDTAPPKSYTYDANGSITNDGATLYTYDSRGRLTQAVTPAGTLQYSLNALGQRIRKTGSGSDVVFHYDLAGHLIGESTALGPIQREIVYLGDIPLAVLQ